MPRWVVYTGRVRTTTGAAHLLVLVDGVRGAPRAMLTTGAVRTWFRSASLGRVRLRVADNNIQTIHMYMHTYLGQRHGTSALPYALM